jgi:hypothetical protein
MASIKFGEKVTFSVTPKIILTLEKMLEEWVVELSENEGDIDLNKASLSVAQKIVVMLSHGQ